jgi:FG-GAP-like repeat/FG-GAP repeat
VGLVRLPTLPHPRGTNVPTRTAGAIAGQPLISGLLALTLTFSASVAAAGGFKPTPTDFLTITKVEEPNWKMAGSGDFNGDGKPDILWRNDASGENSIWLMNGTTPTNFLTITKVEDLNWKMAGSGDFNGDGKPDILWRNYASGENSIWLMNGTTPTDFLTITKVEDLRWEMAGAGDFNGDGKPDILWRNYASGENSIWLMNRGDSTDDDKDGISDVVEAELLARYRPYYRFTKGDNFRPISVLDYIAMSELIPNEDQNTADKIFTAQQLRETPMLLLQAWRDRPDFCTVSPESAKHCSSDLTKNGRVTAFRVNPLEDPPGPARDEPGRHGATPEEVRTLRNVGLYGHVVPIRLRLSEEPNVLCTKRWSNVERAGPGEGQEYYKVEYWQFFGFSTAYQLFNIADHEADWVSVQLLVRPAAPNSPEKIVRVSHFLHGTEISFNLERTDVTATPPAPFGEGQFVEYRAGNFAPDGFKSIDINDKWFYYPCRGDMRRAPDNTLRMFADPDTGAFTHPIVYIEKGAHEFWPTEHGSVNTIVGGAKYHAPSHDGDGDSFLTNTPINLGEVEAPLSMQGPSPLVLRYNGHWGAYGDDPPMGPPLHGNWTWPADSSIGWILGDGAY